MVLAFVLALGALAAAPVAVGAPAESVVQTLDIGALVDAPDGIDPDDGSVFAARRAPARRAPVRRKPSTPRKAVAQPRSPLMIGLAGAGGAAIGSAVGIAGIAVAGVFATGIAGEQPIEVVIATAAVAIGIAVATPFMAGLGGGAGVLLADERTQPAEWSGLLQCAASGYCAGLGSVFSSVLGGGMGCQPTGCTNLPGPDRPAEWTAAASIGGLVAGGLLGVVGGYIVASDKSAPVVPMGVGALGGALVGASLFGGVAGGIASAIRP